MNSTISPSLSLNFLYKNVNPDFKFNTDFSICSVSLDNVFVVSKVREGLSFIENFNSPQSTVPSVLLDWFNHVEFTDFTIIGEFIHTEFSIIISNLPGNLPDFKGISFNHITFYDVKSIYDMDKEFIIITSDSGLKLIYNNYFKPSHSTHSTQASDVNFKYIDIVKTNTPDVYLIDKDFLYVPNLKTSKLLKHKFRHVKQGSFLNMKCIFNSDFDKWQLLD
jgi:hypothetical protein